MAKKLTLEQKIKRAKIWEVIFYVISGLLALFGIILIIFSVIGDYLPRDNFIKNAENATLPIFGISGFSWRYYGIILVFIALVIFLITVYVRSKSSDKSETLQENKSKRTTLNVEAIESNEKQVTSETK